MNLIADGVYLSGGFLVIILVVVLLVLFLRR